MPSAAPTRWLWRLRPRTMMGYWSAAAFLVATLRLLLVQGADSGTLVLFLFPPVLALAFQSSSRQSTRRLAAAFLTLIDFGVSIGPTRRLFPDLRPIDATLSRTDNRVLAWYVLVYLLYVFAVVPPVIFGRGLFVRPRKPGDFGTFTNVLGLVGWILLGPLMCWFCATRFGLWPVYR